MDFNFELLRLAQPDNETFFYDCVGNFLE